MSPQACRAAGGEGDTFLRGFNPLQIIKHGGWAAARELLLARLGPHEHN